MVPVAGAEMTTVVPVMLTIELPAGMLVPPIHSPSMRPIVLVTVIVFGFPVVLAGGGRLGVAGVGGAGGENGRAAGPR